MEYPCDAGSWVRRHRILTVFDERLEEQYSPWAMFPICNACPLGRRMCRHVRGTGPSGHRAGEVKTVARSGLTLIPFVGHRGQSNRPDEPHFGRRRRWSVDPSLLARPAAPDPCEYIPHAPPVGH